MAAAASLSARAFLVSSARRADETNEPPSRDESRTPPSPSRQKKGSAWELHYDSKPEMGFETEIRPVVFTSDGVLEDPGEGTSLRWRREGAEDPVGDDSFDAGDDPVDPNVVHVDGSRQRPSVLDVHAPRVASSQAPRRGAAAAAAAAAMDFPALYHMANP